MTNDVRLIAKCVLCGKKREVQPEGIDKFSVPMCPDCFSPMVTESASTDGASGGKDCRG